MEKIRIRAAAAALLALAALLPSSCAGERPAPPSPETADFDRLHEPVGLDAGIALGGLRIEPAPPGLDPALASYLGRWEGYGLYPPVDKDRKLVLVVRSLSAEGGSGWFWTGTNLQYPDAAGEVELDIGKDGRLEWRPIMPDGRAWKASFALVPGKDGLEGSIAASSGKISYGPFALTRERSFIVYRDYPRYLEGLGARFVPHADASLAKYGSGCLVYLPEGYEEEAEREWPLLLFFHGSGDRGDNPYLLAKASPFMFVREGGKPPFVIVAPLLNSSKKYSAFPDAYLRGLLREALAAYRVDAARVFLTGLSLGGEAAWRLAMLEPGRFAAVAPVSAMSRKSSIKDMRELALAGTPFLVVHGKSDPVIPLSMGRAPAEALAKAGGVVELRILDSDHDAWTATYSDPAFYDWLDSVPCAARDP